MKHKIACLQMNSGPDVEGNLEYIDTQLQEAAAQNIELVQLPENFAQMPASAKTQHIETAGQGLVQDFLRAAAQRYKLAIVAGALPIRELDHPSQNPYARCWVVDQCGHVIAQYDKVHLFNVSLPNGHKYREEDRYSPAEDAQNSIVVADVSGMPIGLSICYDLRFPEQYRNLVSAGAKLLSVPSAFTYETGQAHWQTLLRARAIENLCYVFAAAQTGTHASKRRTWGHSLIIDPWGEVLAQAEAEPGLISAEIDLTELTNIRAGFPALNHRRLI